MQCRRSSSKRSYRTGSRNYSTEKLETRIENALGAHTDQAVFTNLSRSGAVRVATMLAEIGDARGRYGCAPKPPSPISAASHRCA